MAEGAKKKSARRKNDAQPTDAEAPDGGKEICELAETRAAVDAFLADRSQETYDRVLQTFVVEAMTTERSAAFPTSTDIVTKFFVNEGPFPSAIGFPWGRTPWTPNLVQPIAAQIGTDEFVQPVSGQ